jgi:hypothetical protein
MANINPEGKMPLKKKNTNTIKYVKETYLINLVLYFVSTTIPFTSPSR